MKKLLLILPLLFTSCYNNVADVIGDMKYPAIIVLHRKSDTYIAHVVIKDASGKYFDIYDDIFENSKVGDTLK